MKVTSEHNHPTMPLGSNFDQLNKLVILARGEPLFRVKIKEPLYEAYLKGFKYPTERAHHTCNACRHFIERYGNLVIVGNDGELKSALWPGAYKVPGEYREGISEIQRIVTTSTIESAFFTNEAILGTPIAGNFTHFAVELPQTSPAFHREPEKRSAEIKHEFETLMNSLATYPKDVIGTAVEILSFGDLYRSEKVLGPAKFLYQAASLKERSNNRRKNLLWKMAYTAPPGFCHAKTTMIGTLLDDLLNNPKDAAENFKRKMHPLKYQRPTTVKQGNVVSADQLVSKLDVENSFKRRFASLGEVMPYFIWGAEMKPVKKTGIFSSKLSSSPKRDPVGHVRTVTWAVFEETIKAARKIEVKLEDRNMAFVGITTQEVSGSRPILQWDHEDHRNPLSHFFFNGGSTPRQWGIHSGWKEVQGIMYAPWMFSLPKATHFDPFAVLVLPEMQCKLVTGSALFPEHLKSEFHQIRSSVEALSGSGSLKVMTPGGNGLAVGGKDSDAVIRLTFDHSVGYFKVDRWK